MKQYVYSVICSLMLFNLPSLYGQKMPEIALGAGYQLPADKDVNSAAFGGQLHFFYPFLQTKGFSLGPVLGGDYASSKQRPQLSNQPFVEGEEFSSVLHADQNSAFKQSNLGWRFGPQANFQVGRWRISGILQGGQTRWKQDGTSLEQEVLHVGATGQSQSIVRKEIFAREAVSSKSWAWTPRLRISYPLSNRLDLWAEGSMSTSKISVQERTLDFPRDMVLSERTIGNFMEAQSVTTERTANWNTSAIQLGLNLQIGKKPSRGDVAKVNINTSRSNIKQAQDDKKSKTYSKENPIYQGDNKTTDNPLFSRTLDSDRPQDEKRFLRGVYPANNTRFSTDKNVKELRWTLIGTKIPSPKYIVELVRLDNRHQPTRTYHVTTSALSISTEQLAKAALPEGNYRWKVTETTTGTASDPQFFSVGNCQIDFTIKNDTITCLGYEGENRKYRICFESEYQSTSGDLIYTQPGSGLSVFDQSYNALSYTLVAPNPSLQTQVGSTVSTVQYCIEVTVPPSVTGIGLGLQGDDLDSSPIVCRPGASLALDSLPECICKECDELIVDIEQMQITPYNGQTNQFEFVGNLVASHPLYAVEVQVLSFAYSAQPTPCSSGVSVLEESGMILRPGTTIDGSSSLQFMNSTAHPNANGNTSKAIKYLSNSAMTGNIPLNVVVGLPGPLAGFDPDCCKIDYEVCFRIVVYYDENTCKSCVFTKCFQFDNQ